MKRWQKRTLRVVVLALVVACCALALMTRSRAHELMTNAVGMRKTSTDTPATYQLAFDDVTVTTSDGLKLVGWYLPSTNGAALIVQHGYKDSRDMMLKVSALFNRHGYGVLIDAVRAHDGSGGELITFGHDEMKDVDAFYRYLAARPDVDPNRIGMYGVSMGGSLTIQYAAENPSIRAIAMDSAFSSVSDTVATSVSYFTGLPAFPFAPMILFWSERLGAFRAEDMDAKLWIGRINPRPVFLMQGGADVVVSPESGRKLYEAAGEPKELWFDPALGHVQFLVKHADEFERRVVGFYDRYLIR
jgi:fermentation-respiration switch protein FrsA (DUF1100 family)